MDSRALSWYVTFVQLFIMHGTLCNLVWASVSPNHGVWVAVYTMQSNFIQCPDWPHPAGDVWCLTEGQRVELQVCPWNHHVPALACGNGLRLLFRLIHPPTERGESRTFFLLVSLKTVSKPFQMFFPLGAEARSSVVSEKPQRPRF